MADDFSKYSGTSIIRTLLGPHQTVLIIECRKQNQVTFSTHAHSLHYVIVIARVLGIYGSKPTRVRGRSPRTRAVYVAINP